jgi:hypothetical protein
VDIGAVTGTVDLQMIYISDTTATATAKRGLRIKNGATLGTSTKNVKGITIVSDNPIYVQGNFNTGGNPPSNTGTYTSPTVSGYTWKPCAIVADAINVLSNNWNDANAPGPATRIASPTTINAAFVAGIVPSDGVNYSGGGENFVRFLENWSGQSFTYYGSMVQFWKSKQATGPWSSSNNVYTAPTTNKWFYDIHFAGDPDNPANNANPIPPGNPGFQLAAYLQQQRWYQVY